MYVKMRNSHRLTQFICLHKEIALQNASGGIPDTSQHTMYIIEPITSINENGKFYCSVKNKKFLFVAVQKL